MHLDGSTLVALGTFITVVSAAIGALLVKVWPMLTKSKGDRLSLEAKLRMDAHEQVSAEYQEMIDRQQKQIDGQQTKLDTMYSDMRTMQQAHADCMVAAERYQARLTVLEARLERVNTTQAVGDIPTRSEALVVTNQEGTITEWNEAATVLFHWASAEAVGMDVRKLIPPRYLPLHDARWSEVLRTGRPVRRGPFVVEALTKDGAKIAVEMILSSWIEAANGGGQPAVYFSASLRRLPVDPRGRVLERGGYRPLPIPEPSADAAAIAASASDAAAPAGSISVTPAPGGGSNVSVPPGGTAHVQADSLHVTAASDPKPPPAKPDDKEPCA